MAIELCSSPDTSSTGMSPRISFSHDLQLSDIVPIEQHPFRSNSTGGDFDFCVNVRKSFDQDSSSADELFSDGKILPTEIKKKSTAAPSRDTSISSGTISTHTDLDSSKKDILPETKSDETEEIGNNNNRSNNKTNSRSFWKFKRSSSLNCGSSYARGLCPLPPLLSRSNSTGSTPSVKRATTTTTSSKETRKQHKQAIKSQQQLQPMSSSVGNLGFQKPPLKKNYGQGVRVNPVLNVPSGSLFGLGSIFFNGKDKCKRN